MKEKNQLNFSWRRTEKLLGPVWECRFFNKKKIITFFSLFISVKNMTEKKKVQIPENLTEH